MKIPDLHSIAYILMGVGLLTACDATGTAPQRATPMRRIAQPMARAQTIIPLSPAELEALDRLVAKLPADHREKSRRIIADKISRGHFVRIKDNPELQQELDKVYAARKVALGQRRDDSSKP